MIFWLRSGTLSPGNEIFPAPDQQGASNADATATTEATIRPQGSSRDAGRVVTEDISSHVQNIRARRNVAYSGLFAQTKRMTKRSRVDFKAGEGDDVVVSIPAVDRWKGDPRRILDVITVRDLDTHLARIAVNDRILSGLSFRNELHLCPQQLLTKEDVSLDKSVATLSFCRSVSFGRTRLQEMQLQRTETLPDELT